MPTALVTGATGFIGSHLVDLLLERGYRVSVTLRPTSRLRWLEGKPVGRVEADLGRPLRLPACDVLFHVAGVLQADSWGAYLAGNRDVSRHAVEGAETGRFVHVSTLAVTGPGEGVDERTPCAPISLYGRSKWEGERAVWERRDRAPVTVIRPPVVYGPRDTGLLDLYRTVARGVRPQVGADKRLSAIHVRDLVEGMAAAAESPRGANEVFFLAHPEPCATSELLDLVERGLGSRALRVALPDRVVRLLGAVSEDGARLLGKRTLFNRDKALEMTQPAWTCSPARARELLGWEARIPLDRGLPETLGWYRAEGLL